MTASHSPEHYLQLLNSCNARLLQAVDKLDLAVARRQVPAVVAYTVLRSIARTSHDVNAALLTMEMAQDIDASLAMLDGLATFAETEVDKALTDVRSRLRAAGKPRHPGDAVSGSGALKLSRHKAEEV